jgi:hypothetical protein
MSLVSTTALGNGVRFSLPSSSVAASSASIPILLVAVD